MDVSIPTKMAIRFAYTTGIEFEYLFSVALEAYWRAATDERYDPRKAAFSTFATHCIYHALCSAAARHKRKYPPVVFDPLDADIPSAAPSPERLAFFSELMRQLPDDAKVVVDLVLNVLDGVPAYRVKSTIRRRLRSQDQDGGRWPVDRIDSAFHAVGRMVRQLESFG